MLPLHLTGIALAGRMLLTKHSGNTLPAKGVTRSKSLSGTNRMPQKPSLMPNPLHSLFRDLTTSLSQITSKPVREDYSALIKSFIPENARLLVPEYPSGARDVLLADLDGDSRDELIASYTLHSEVKTIILKRQEGNWFKASEISNSGYDMLNYRGTADITGEGKKQLLIGLKSRDKVGALAGYSFEQGISKEIFTHGYHRFEVLQSDSRNTSSNAQIAVWNRKDNNSYDIELLRWNGSQLESLKDSSAYYHHSVIPYYVDQVRQVPYSISNWYNLADALIKTGDYRDALVAIDVGMSQDQNSALREKFLELRKKIPE